MAINWKLRENVFRLLAAVYAEMGEVAVSPLHNREITMACSVDIAQFKGRYGSIAKFYGPDATYDAVKSFFAKEITKAAEDLHNQNPSHRRTSREVPPKTKSSHRTLHLDFNDQDLSFISEREVEVHSRHALQRPPKRPRNHEPPQPQLLQGPQAPDIIAPEKVEIDPSIPGPNDQRSFNGQRRHPTPHEPQLPPWPREFTSASTDPEYFPSPSPQCEPSIQPHKAPRKRPFKSIAQVDLELDHQTTSSSSQHTQAVAQDTESFGYVTNTGFYRCALCFSQLPSQEALEKHEQLSKLHLRNLQNPAMLSQGRTKLAQVTAVPNHRPYQSSASPTAFRPLPLGAFENAVTGEPSLREPNAQSWTDTSPSSGPSSSNHLGAQSHGAGPESSSSIDTLDSGSHLVKPSTPEIVPTGGATRTALEEVWLEEAQTRTEDKGKQRAKSCSGPTLAHDEPSNNTHIPETTSVVPDQPHNINAPHPENEKHPTHGRSNPKTTAPKPKSRLRPLEVAEILRVTGIRLAESYMAEHPDLISQTMGRVQREFTAASTTTRGADGSVESRSESMGLSEVLQAVDEEQERQRQAQRRDRGGKLNRRGQGPPVSMDSGVRQDAVGSGGAGRKGHLSDGRDASGKRPPRATHAAEVVVILD